MIYNLSTQPVNSGGPLDPLRRLSGPQDHPLAGLVHHGAVPLLLGP